MHEQERDDLAPPDRAEAVGVEVVFGDAPAGAPLPFQDDDAPAGRITSIELRRPAARVCDLPVLVDRLREGTRGLVVDAGGVGPVRLGETVDQLVAALATEQPQPYSVDAEHHAADVRPEDRPGAHHAGFGRRVERGAGEFLAAYAEGGGLVLVALPEGATPQVGVGDHVTGAETVLAHLG